MNTTPPKQGDLRVWHIPQIPGKAFHVPVDSIKTAKLILKTLADYDLFQYKNRIKGDYSNAAGLECYHQYGAPNPPDDFPDWCEWENEDVYNIDDVDENGKTK